MKKMMPLVVMVIIMLISLIFAYQGVNMHAKVNSLESEFHSNQAEYFNLAKSVRDSAETGSELNKQLIEIQQTPSELLRFKLVGVGKILTGIYALLFGILIALIMMPIRLGKMINKK